MDVPWILAKASLDPVFNSLPRLPRAASVWMQKYLVANCNALVAALLLVVPTELDTLQVALRNKKVPSRLAPLLSVAFLQVQVLSTP